MRSRQVYAIGGLIVLTVFAVAGLWEFLLEDRVLARLNPGYVAETADEHWRYVAVAVGASVVSLIAPLWLFNHLGARQARAEEALAESRERLKAFAENPDWVWEIDETGVYTYASSRVHDFLGYTPEEVIGKAPFDLMPPDEAARMAKEFAAITSERRSFSLLENVTLHRDGHRVFMETSGVPIFDKRGAFRGYRGIDRDITARKQAEAAVRESEARFAKAFQASPAAMAISEIDDGRLLDANAMWLSLWGFTRGEAIGKTAVELHNWADLEQRAIFVERLKRDGSIRDFEAIFLTKGGQERTVLLAGETIEIGGEPRLLLVFHDITERQSMERRLRHVQKMEVVGQLAGGTAHDFNNLLQIIQSSIDLAQSQLDKDDRIHIYLENAMEAARRGGRLTHQLLSFSRKETLNPEIVRPAALIEGLLDLIRRSLGETIEVETRLERDLPTVRIDPHGLENALVNIAFNAKAAMPDGGRLTIAAGRRHVEQEIAGAGGADSPPAGDYVEINLTDTGCGMTPDVLEHAFEPFFTTREVGEGSGLGLSMVYGFARQSGGIVTLESEPGRGTRVCLMLPTAAKEPSDA
ncbi:PAS domain-containing sensor histidine kinase [Shumkonia mesophila]|uniref:PAS domain-containing sensor histidine kinase n=1 Tax=Shumkonia mesophila TaxID=2838854 RepID=UPI002934A6C0|nr:PAS domain S-box protein [Shumkonia mesophila]